MQTESSDDGQALAPVQATLAPSKRVAGRETEEVAGRSIVNTQVLTIEIAWSTSLGADLLTLKHKGHVVGEFELSALCLEVQSGLSRERGYEGSHHR